MHLPTLLPAGPAAHRAAPGVAPLISQSANVPPVGGVPPHAPVGPALRPRPIVPTGETSRRGCEDGVPPSGGTAPVSPAARARSTAGSGGAG